MLRLIAAEIDRFQIWSSPRPEAEFDDENYTKEEKDLRQRFKTQQDKATVLPDKEWKRMARIAWAISPHLGLLFSRNSFKIALKIPSNSVKKL